jgi:hypothetical protein
MINKDRGYETLITPAGPYEGGLNFEPNYYYERYLKMHKVFVGNSGAEQLEDIYQGLRGEEMPRYLTTAGWAAVEASLVQSQKSTEQRQRLLDGAVDCWVRALESQKMMNGSGEDYLTEYSQPFRTALDIAVSPLFQDMLYGNVRPETITSVFDDCLNIAQVNSVRTNLMRKQNNFEGVADHTGFGYEVNALLAFNRRFSERWFVIPSMVRSDNGYHHREQTHDLLVVNQNWGELKSLTPLEVKSVASGRDLKRYKALVVRGKMHLSVSGKCRPEETLEAISAWREGSATSDESRITDDITETVVNMIRDYHAGERLGELATGPLMEFRDSSVVSSKHPGLRIAA